MLLSSSLSVTLINRQNLHHGLSPRHEEESPQKPGARASPGRKTGTVRPRIGNNKAYDIYSFFVGVLEVIYLAVRPCGAFLVILRK